MLHIIIPREEGYDAVENLFTELKPAVPLVLEHSLVSMSKWEAKWKKPFLSKEGMTREQTLDYIRAMTITQNVNDDVYNRLNEENINQVTAYIEDSMSATTFRETPGSRNSEIVTSELIYFWMVTFNIPFECQRWHLNRLLTLIRICNIKNQPPKKQRRADILKNNKMLNDARRTKLNTPG